MVDIAPEDHDPANWKSWLEDDNGNLNEDELPWYGSHDESPSYGPDAPPPAQIEAARRFVSHWLNEDSHGFVIPGGEWGLSLMHWLNILVARPAVDAQRPQEAVAAHWSQGVGIEVVERFSRKDLTPLAALVAMTPEDWHRLLEPDDPELFAGVFSEEEIREARELSRGAMLQREVDEHFGTDSRKMSDGEAD